MPSQKKKWVERYAKVGYAAKGIVYILVGALTAMAAIGIGGQKASNTDAFLQLKRLPGGGFLLGLLAAGLIGYSLWRFTQAILDTEDKGASTKAIGKRAAYAFSGFIYGSLAVVAFKIGLGSANNKKDGSREEMVITELLQKPFGKWLAIAIGLLTIGNGLYQLKKAITKSFMKEVKNLPPQSYHFLEKSGRAGFASRGIVFCIIGYLFVSAAWHQNPKEAEGTKGAFTFLQTSPFGSWILAAVSVGLIGYGIFMFVQAKYSDISID
ncbi:DUF1206 domain-containing protein [Rufibacter ruber]|uniref:DUF1206 domain-containing protein n=1 Tax=Rufibacter ruber TaxID=1783499 RepID=UPI0008306E97|nr:DUF1206 domain-containing protein [Rufibacter ruber]